MIVQTIQKLCALIKMNNNAAFPFFFQVSKYLEWFLCILEGLSALCHNNIKIGLIFISNMGTPSREFRQMPRHARYPPPLCTVFLSWPLSLQIICRPVLALNKSTERSLNHTSPPYSIH